jgi:hypothetical protein
MSDRASQSDSDAVLASIRRILVNSQDDRAAPRDDTPSEPLILTEALRVDAGGTTAGDTGGATDDPDAALDWQDETGPDAPTAAEGDHTRQDLPAGTAASALEDTVVDEDFLRDIVSEIVREELQGDLGERITRNVRKLVRREIHRALASRDFD